MKLFNLIITSAILVSGLSATELKRSMKVVPMDPKYLSTEHGGANHASAALADGVGIYTTQEDEYAKTISYLNGKYGDDALKNEKSLKEYVLDNGTAADKELAKKLNLNATPTQKSNPGDSCDDGDSATVNDMYTDDEFTCQGKKIYYDNKCKGDEIGSEFEFEGETYLVVDNISIKTNLHRAETLCTSNVTDMSNLFKDSFSFNKPIGNWDTSNVTNMSYMLHQASSFNQPIGDWEVSNVTNMDSMFKFNSSFNQPIGKWNTSNVTTMSSMFQSTRSFNQPIGKWDTSKVTNMQQMFLHAYSFNQSIEDWDTSNVTNMHQMFSATTSFNQAIGIWVTSNVTNMQQMFYEAKSFNQDISTWNTDKVTGYRSFARDSALTRANAPSKNGTKFETTKP